MDNIQYRPPCPPAPESRALAMVYGVNQRLKQIWEPAQAIRSGTLYPELYKPMAEKSMPIDCPNASARQAISFSAWELRLYLDTHPDDAQALELYRRYCGPMDRPGYACAFTPDGQDADVGSGCGERWRWLDNPWPWELRACEQTEGECDVCV